MKSAFACSEKQSILSEFLTKFCSKAPRAAWMEGARPNATQGILDSMPGSITQRNAIDMPDHSAAVSEAAKSGEKFGLHKRELCGSSPMFIFLW